MMNPPRWYVAATQSSREQLARQQLANQGFTVFLPLRDKSVRHARRIITRKAPLFPGYLFVGMDVAKVRWRAINGTRGVKYLIAHDDRPAALPRGFVEAMIAGAGADGSLRYAVALRPGDPVEVMAGPFAGQIGELLSLDDRGRVTLLLQLLAGHVPVRTTASNLLPA